MNPSELLTLIDVAKQRGLEIGPLNRPLVTRAMGPVEYIDRASRADLAAWYADPVHDIDPATLVEVDHIWGDQSLLDCVGGRRDYDYLIASHVIEHVPDLYGWLGEVASVLKDDGLALFVVPDKRFTFDMARQTSVSGDFVDAHLRGLRRPDTRQVFNHYNDTHHVGAAALDDAARTERAREGLDLCRRMAASGEYIDCHAWVFTPMSIVAALDLASRLGLLPFAIAALKPTAPGAIDFLLALRRLPEGMAPDARRAAFAASADGLALPEEDIDVSAELETARTEARLARARAEAIERSTIWRLTAPLRRMIELARGGPLSSDNPR